MHIHLAIPGNISGLAGLGSEQPDPVEDIPAPLRWGWSRWTFKGMIL